jgi:hypothetical protein
MSVTINQRFKVAGYNAATWTSGTVLEARELGLELDTGKAKLGDGAAPWGSLGYHYFWSTWARIDSKPTTLAGYGITDAAVATSGTWTPSFGGDGGDPTIGYTQQNGTWIRHGNVMHLFGELQINTIAGGSGNLLIKGLPVASASPRYQGVLSVGYAGSFVTNFPTGGYVPASSSFAYVCGDVGGARTNLAVSVLQSATTCIFHLIYRLA